MFCQRKSADKKPQFLYAAERALNKQHSSRILLIQLIAGEIYLLAFNQLLQNFAVFAHCLISFFTIRVGRLS